MILIQEKYKFLGDVIKKLIKNIESQQTKKPIQFKELEWKIQKDKFGSWSYCADTFFSLSYKIECLKEQLLHHQVAFELYNPFGERLLKSTSLDECKNFAKKDLNDQIKTFIKE